MIAPSPSPNVLAEAIERFARLRAAEPSAEQLDDLNRWLEASSEHGEAFESVNRQWSGMETLRGDTSLMFLRDDARRQAQWAQVAKVGLLAVAASLVAAVILAGVTAPSLYRRHLDLRARQHATVYATAVGEVSNVRLADGTLATLDTNTVLRSWQVRDGRFVELVRGRARFRVVKDSTRPFSVLAQGKSVTALGTDFDVYLRPESLRVTLAEGRLRVKTEKSSQDLPSVDMTPGYQFTASRGGWALAKADPAASLSWTERQLSFDDSTLAEIAAELNRYSRRKIVINDAAVGQLRMSAVIKNTDAGSFLGAVDELSLAKVRQVGDDFELIGR